MGLRSFISWKCTTTVPWINYIKVCRKWDGAAAILSLVALGTQQWVTSQVLYTSKSTSTDGGFVKFGLFTGSFRQRVLIDGTFELTMHCDFEMNICALLCGNNIKENLKRLHRNQDISKDDKNACLIITPNSENRDIYYQHHGYLAGNNVNQERVFINAGMWVATILFLCLSAGMGLISAGLSLWNTLSTPKLVYFGGSGVYFCNAIALFCIVLSMVFWGVLFSQNIIHNIPTYHTFLDGFTTYGLARLGYSYWINLVSVCLYVTSVCLLYARNYFIAQEQKADVRREENIDLLRKRLTQTK